MPARCWPPCLSAELRADPRWPEAAQALISGCADLGPDGSVELLEQVCEGLGEQLYPAFLRVLIEVNQRGDFAARALVARSLALALQQGRLPSGRRAAWGQASAPRATRSLGPLEYLCLAVWPGAQGSELSSEQFQLFASAVMELFDCAPDARQHYASQLLAVAGDALDGTLPREARGPLQQLARQWLAGAEAGAICAQYCGSAASRNAPQRSW